MDHTHHIQASCDAVQQLISERDRLGPYNEESEKINRIIYAYFALIKAFLQKDVLPYFADHSIRNMLNETFRVNPFAPKSINGVDVETLAPPPLIHGANCIISQIKNNNIPIEVETFRPDINSYVRFLTNNAHHYASRFGVNPLHGTGYFFQKTLEHFITSHLIGECQSRTILDIGSAGHVYASVLKNQYPDAVLIVQDLCFPVEAKNLGNNVFQLGGSAATLPLEDNTVDFVTFHCSIEHFEGNADIDCLREVQRVLRPGGRAVIVPLHHNSEYTIGINPISGPFADDDFIKNSVLTELNENAACLFYGGNFVSRFVRQYSAAMIVKRLLSNLDKLSLKLFAIEIGKEFSENEILPAQFLNGLYNRYVPHQQRFFLQFTKH